MYAVHVILELEAGDPIRGSLRVVDGPRQQFVGLLELVAVLDRVRPNDSAGAADDGAGSWPGAET